MLEQERNSLRSEIEFWLENNSLYEFRDEPNFETLLEQKTNYSISNFDFPLFHYFYDQNNSISLRDYYNRYPEDFSLDKKHFFSRISSTYQKKYYHEISSGLDVNVSCSYELNNHNLEQALSKIGIKLIRTLDLEFFEEKTIHREFLENLTETKLLNLSLDTQTQKLRDKSSEFKNFYINFFNANNESRSKEFGNFFENIGEITQDQIIDLIDIEGNKINKNVLTAFLDTEKIHFKFIYCKKEKTKAWIPVYMGYGNYDVFSKNLLRNGSSLRHNKLDILRSLNTNYVLSELKKSPNQRLENLLNWIDVSQKNYFNHFQTYFSYDKTINDFKNKNPNHKAFPIVDKYFMINPAIRSKAAALSAYDLFKREIYLSGNDANFDSILKSN